MTPGGGNGAAARRWGWAAGIGITIATAVGALLATDAVEVFRDAPREITALQVQINGLNMRVEGLESGRTTQMARDTREALASIRRELDELRKLAQEGRTSPETRALVRGLQRRIGALEREQERGR